MLGWGSTIHGQLGLGGIEDENFLVPQEINFEKTSEIKQVSCGDNFSVILTNNGQMYSCGNNDYGQLGHNKSRKKFQLIDYLNTLTFKAISCGASFTLAINEWDQLYSWGSNSDGQLGLNSDVLSESAPKLVKTLGSKVVIQITCGCKHALALTNNGELYSWGSNEEGQLGIGLDFKIKYKPTFVNSLIALPIAFISCGGYHSIVVSKSGSIYGWGRNTFGQLGINEMNSKNLPCQLKTLRNTKVKYVSCGEDFTAFLTMDGRLFTCGAGMYGQLGHGSKNHEILPRQIMELMGSIVTQICCGKRHMLAFIPSRGRIYSWGLGGTGQLGIRVTRTVTTPQVVLGSWVSPSGVPIYSINDSANQIEVKYVVKHIYCGGDHCFATVTKQEENIPPDDCRVLDELTQILTIKEEFIHTCQKFQLSESLSHDVMTYLETVFQSLSCINGSFLLPNDGHYGCTSRNYGLDNEQISRVFGLISDLPNITIQEIIFTSITENLIPSLSISPPDVETLRIYIILTLYHKFLEPDNFEKLQTPFAKAFLSLKLEAKKIVGIWWSKAPPQIFYRLIRSYKAVTLFILKRLKDNGNNIIPEPSLNSALEMLKFIHELNQTSSEGLRVPYDTFHLPELIDIVDLRTDYIKWLGYADPNSIGVILFSNYPFLLDAQAKTMLLEIDQAIQMHSAMNEAATRAFTTMFHPFISNDTRQNSQFLLLNVSRENLVVDTLRELSEQDSNDLKKPLRIKFHGEEAEDAGGVKKEFFMLLLKEILDPKYGMFKQYDETRNIWFNQDSLEDEMMYFLIGILCGLVIYNFIIIDLPFPLVLYKKLLNEPVILSDLKDLSPILAKSLQNLLDYNEPDLDQVFCINFEVTRDAFGQQKIHELIPQGSNTPVTLDNKYEFVNLYVDYIFNKSVESQFNAFYKGFHKVCGGRVLKLFHSHELMAVIVGNENYDWKELQDNASYKEGYTKDDLTVQLFWQVFHELSIKEKKKFLLFLTGSDRIPIQGMKAIKITIQPMNDEKFLPVAHTCFNLLDLPRYQTREKLRYKLLQAIQQTQGFSLV